MSSEQLIYPILLRDAPDWLGNLIQDSGVPVTYDGNSSGADHLVMIINEKIENESQDKPCLKIEWRSLLPDYSMPEKDIFRNLYFPRATCWYENGIELRENCISDSFRSNIIANLRKKLIAAGLPWVIYKHCPAHYHGIFNFRVDIDENQPEDWRRLIQALSPMRGSTTWFLSMAAAVESPEIYDWLNDCDVNSHGFYHHIHQFDHKLNRLLMQKADNALKGRGFSGRGFAPPSGRYPEGLASIASEMKYHFVAGLGDPNGNIPIRNAGGIWQINSLPVSEGLYLDLDISDAGVVVDGYLAIARRAIERRKPVLIYGHAERRLGRRTEIVENLLERINLHEGLWNVSLSDYINWLEKRNQIKLEVSRPDDHSKELQFSWRHMLFQKSPAIHVEWHAESRTINLSEIAGQRRITLRSTEQTEFQKIETDARKAWLNINEKADLKTWVKTFLDWEREIPVRVLIKGVWRSRIKAVLRYLTDAGWKRKNKAREWTMTDGFSKENSLAA